MYMVTGATQPIILAAGGTGGHIFPAEALAEALLAMGERVILVTDKRFGHFKTGVLSQIETRTIRAGGMGASVFSSVVPGAIAKLPASLRARVRVDQQCREMDLAETRDAYQAAGVNADLESFFVDLPARLAGCHLVIARSGASTVSELGVSGRPAILVPLPTAMDNHQYYNANAFEDVGGGWVMTQDGFTVDSLSARLEGFLMAPATLAKAAENAKKCGSPDAAQKLAQLVLEAGGIRHLALGIRENNPLIPNPQSPMPLKTEAA